MLYSKSLPKATQARSTPFEQYSRLSQQDFNQKLANITKSRHVGVDFKGNLVPKFFNFAQTAANKAQTRLNIMLLLIAAQNHLQAIHVRQITKLARMAGLISGREDSSTSHVELNKIIGFIHQRILGKPMDMNACVDVLRQYQMKHAKALSKRAAEITSTIAQLASLAKTVTSVQTVPVTPIQKVETTTVQQNSETHRHDENNQAMAGEQEQPGAALGGEAALFQQPEGFINEEQPQAEGESKQNMQGQDASTGEHRDDSFTASAPIPAVAAVETVPAVVEHVQPAINAAAESLNVPESVSTLEETVSAPATLPVETVEVAPVVSAEVQSVSSEPVVLKTPIKKISAGSKDTLLWKVATAATVCLAVLAGLKWMSNNPLQAKVVDDTRLMQTDYSLAGIRNNSFCSSEVLPYMPLEISTSPENIQNDILDASSVHDVVVEATPEVEILNEEISASHVEETIVQDEPQVVEVQKALENSQESIQEQAEEIVHEEVQADQSQTDSSELPENEVNEIIVTSEEDKVVEETQPNNDQPAETTPVVKQTHSFIPIESPDVVEQTDENVATIQQPTSAESPQQKNTYAPWLYTGGVFAVGAYLALKQNRKKDPFNIIFPDSIVNGTSKSSESQFQDKPAEAVHSNEQPAVDDQVVNAEPPPAPAVEASKARPAKEENSPKGSAGNPPSPHKGHGRLVRTRDVLGTIAEEAARVVGGFASDILPKVTENEPIAETPAVAVHAHEQPAVDHQPVNAKPPLDVEENEAQSATEEADEEPAVEERAAQPFTDGSDSESEDAEVGFQTTPRPSPLDTTEHAQAILDLFDEGLGNRTMRRKKTADFKSVLQYQSSLSNLELLDASNTSDERQRQIEEWLKDRNAEHKESEANGAGASKAYVE